MRLAGTNALVTGASRGIGREIAIALAREGAAVALTGRSRRDLEETKRRIGRPDTRVVPADLRSEKEIDRLARFAQSQMGALDILVNAAGVWHDGRRKYQGPILPETPAGQIDEILAVGVRASFLLSRRVAAGMVKRRHGKVLQIACGFAGPHEATGWLHYYVTNKAIEAFTEGLAAELRPFDIQVNCIAPWFVASEAVRKFYPKESRTALDPADVARMAVFLVSEEADHVSGQVIQLRSKRDTGGPS